MLVARLCDILIWLSIAHQFNAAVPVSSFLPFGLNVGDTRVPTGDDNSAGPVSLRTAFPFFSNRESVVYVNTNGGVSFAQGISQFTPTCGALSTSSRMVAAFWADVDTRNGGDVYYRETTDSALLATVSQEVYNAYPLMWGVDINWLFVATWYKVAYFGCCGSGCSALPYNTFQLILASDGTYSFAVFYYNSITWTTGTASGGSGCGLGGNPAKVGFDQGDGINFYAVPASCTSSIINIPTMSNLPASSPGKFVFRIDNVNSLRGCTIGNDPTLVQLVSAPTYAQFMGNIPIKVSGPCLYTTSNVTCLFYDPNGNQTLSSASLITENSVRKAVCAAPYFKRTGITRTKLKVQGYNSSTSDSNNVITTIFDGPFTVTSQEPTLIVSYARSTSQVSLNFVWDPSFFSPISGFNSSALAVAIRMIVFDSASANWKIALNVVPYVLSNQSSISATLVFGSVSWLVSTESVSMSFVAFRIDVVDSQPQNGISNTLIFKTGQSNTQREQQCTTWYQREPYPSTNQPACPPLLAQALLDWRFESEPLNAIGGIVRPDAAFSYRSRVPVVGTGFCQQCTYNKLGQLLFGPVNGGNLRTAHPLVDPLAHWLQDVVPFCDCCLELTNEHCALYYQKRPSNPGTNYRPPNLVMGSGDPHFTTLDGVQYTFNPIGEFWLIRQRLSGGARFEVQTRIEKYVASDSSEQPLNASVFTAFVMRRTDSSSSSASNSSKTVQVQRSMTTTSGLQVLIDGTLLQLDNVMNKSQRVDNFAIDALYIDNKLHVRVVFDAGWALDFSSSQNALTYTVAASDQNKNSSSGLLGNFNGISDDDFSAPDSSSLSITASLYDIHYNFGMKWKVFESESLFTYASGRNYSSYQDTTFVPSFRVPSANELTAEARAMCGSSLACIYDVVTTGGNMAFANNTVVQEQRVKSIINTLSTTVIMCPALGVSSYGIISTTIGYFNGSVATLICILNSTLSGNNFTICLNGAWSSAIGDCIESTSANIQSTSGFVSEINAVTNQAGSYAALIGGLVGGIALVVIIVLVSIAVIVFCCYRRNKERNIRQEEFADNTKSSSASQSQQGIDNNVYDDTHI